MSSRSPDQTTMIEMPVHPAGSCSRAVAAAAGHAADFGEDATRGRQRRLGGGGGSAGLSRGMTGQNMICFAKDWDENPTSNNQILRLLGRGTRGLWLNSIATRPPSLRSGRDLKKIVRKLMSFL